MCSNIPMRCFVASAFGRADVDRVYNQLVKPILSQLGIGSSRVDQIVHNDDIVDKILELLDQADFCIADLTHARPSVYFEAGYAQKTKPVIFIARKDHFTPRDTDPEGNFRVHFDVRNKNIIPWGESDKKFARALRSRILYVTGPLRRELANRQEREAERRAFLHLSQSARLQLVRNEAERILRSRGFRIEGNSGSQSFQAIRYRSGVETQVILFARATFTRRALELAYSWYGHGKCDTTRQRRHSRFDTKAVILLFASLEPLPLTRLHKAFPMHAPWLDRGLLKWTITLEGAKTLESIVAPVGHVQSRSEFEERFGRLLKPLLRHLRKG
jgi:hypothetical protein